MKINRLALALSVVVAAPLVTACSTSQSDARQEDGALPNVKASAQLFDAAGTKRGLAVLVENGAGLKLEVNAEGLASGTYGIHLHTAGKCEGPAFTSAGSHWNPMARQHGFENPQGSHEGDLPNLEVVAGKTTEYSREIKGATLSAGHMPVLDADGTAIVIHAKPDDYKTDPSGNSGDRIICGTFALG